MSQHRENFSRKHIVGKSEGYLLALSIDERRRVSDVKRTITKGTIRVLIVKSLPSGVPQFWNTKRLILTSLIQ